MIQILYSNLCNNHTEFYKLTVVGVHKRDRCDDALPQRSSQEASVLRNQTMRPSQADYTKSQSTTGMGVKQIFY